MAWTTDTATVAEEPVLRRSGPSEPTVRRSRAAPSGSEDGDPPARVAGTSTGTSTSTHRSRGGRRAATLPRHGWGRAEWRTDGTGCARSWAGFGGSLAVPGA